VKLRKGDRVVVLTGKDRGKQGDVMRALPQQGKVIVEGVNIVKRHEKQRRATVQAGIIDKDMPLPVSSVAIVCKTCGRSRVGYTFDPQGRKVRICKKCGDEI
jgi:large subunit ribosomal protein L24